VKLFTKVFSDAIIEGRSRYMKSKEFLADKSKKGPEPARDRGPRGRREGSAHEKGPDRKPSGPKEKPGKDAKTADS
jgi:hypothetical protein